MAPADILATTIAAVIGLYATYRIVMWLADRAINVLHEMTRHEK
jgi:hypothetical protein